MNIQNGFSFDYDLAEVMDFSTEFLPKMKSDQTKNLVMRDSTSSLRLLLEEDIVYPQFYHDYGEFTDLEFTMG